MASGCVLSPSPSFPPATPGMDLRARKASPSKSSVLKVSWSRTVTTRQAPGAWHWSRDTRLGYSGDRDQRMSKTSGKLMAVQVHLAVWKLRMMTRIVTNIKPTTYNSKASSKRGLRSQLLIWVQRSSTSGKMWLGSRLSCTNGSLKPGKSIKALSLQGKVA